APLARMVCGRVGPGALGGGGNDVDDVSASRPRYLVQGELRQDEGAAEGDGHDAIPIGDRQLCDGYGEVRAGIIDEDVQAIVSRDDLADGVPGLLLRSDIEVQGHAAATAAAEGAGHLLGLIHADIGRYRDRTGLVERSADRLAQALAAPCD